MRLNCILPTMAIIGMSCLSCFGLTTGNAPIANAGPDRPDVSINEPAIVLGTSGSVSVQLDGSLSDDIDGDISTLVWTDGTQTITGPFPPGLFPIFTYSSAGVRVITITVTDATGLTSVDTMQLTISEGNVCVPELVTPAANKTVECNGTGNIAELTAWLSSNGGAVVSNACGATTWTNNFVEATSWSFGVCPIVEQATVTFTATNVYGSTVATTATFYIKDTTAPPLNWMIDGTPVADYSVVVLPLASLPVEVKVNPADLCCGSRLEKSYAFSQGSGSVTYSSSANNGFNDTVTLNSASNSAKVRFYFKATDDCGNASATEWVEIDVVNKVKTLKGNEGVGNGVDPNTPGALHNGNNDALGFTPGNPGARHKHL